MRLSRTLAVLTLTAAAAACGGDSTPFPYSDLVDTDRISRDSGTTLDAGTGEDATTGRDVTTTPDTSTGSDTGTVDPSCSRSGFDANTVQVTADGSNVDYLAVTSTDVPYDMLRISSLADWAGPTAPGTYSLDGINYRDCGLCLLAYADCGESECAKTFYADAGDVVIDAIGFEEGDAFSGRLQNVVFREVTIEQDFTSTPVPGGETWCMNGLTFEGFSQSAPQAGECDPNSYDCIGEELSSFQLQSCDTGEMVDVAAAGAGSDGTWMILTAGWCTACHAWLPEVFGALDSDLAEFDINLMVVLGEDTNGGQPTLDYCRGYAEQYGHGLSNFYLDHDGTQSYATVFSNVWIYPGEGGSFGLPWNGMFNSAGEYVYADGAGVGDVNAGLNAMLQ